MPFVPQESRDKMEIGLPPETVGDMCYLEYKKLIKDWEKEPRWTTAHNLCKQVFDVSDEQAAKFLAYMVFFNFKVIPYELEKETENGTI